ncbi:hypothetical protein EGW08_018863 [Elysia chlorotica]|uniref:AAA+ ATPase domain-containing protein n=1 Tax=Elysia chlorotica TaxID=188477 RepID=A0A433SW22_ELYCH|nr:hypothetical protein EGW08_018863 [Elysia chlorotica]
MSSKIKSKQSSENIPLAAKMRPCDLEHFVGQSQAIKKNSLLYNILSFSEKVPSMILWGPPGCGKQLANLATNDMKMLRRNTILFLDEIHRFNKLQQDTLLPYVENGTLTLIGATTENPSFHVNSALLSRCRVVVLEKLSVDVIGFIFVLIYFFFKHSPTIVMEDEALDMLAGLTDGDARSALNGLQLAWEGCLAQATETQRAVSTITVDIVKEALQRSHILYDKTGKEHYNIVSAMIKSLRGSDADAALYWMVRMLEGGENPLFIARRLVIFASEDIGLADPMALTQAVSTHQACHILGMPECALNLTHCVMYLAQASKSASVLKALTAARSCIRQHMGPQPSVPLHLRNSSTKLQDDLGYAKGYKYPPDYNSPVKQDYLPPSLKGTKFVPS